MSAKTFVNGGLLLGLIGAAGLYMSPLMAGQKADDGHHGDDAHHAEKSAEDHGEDTHAAEKKGKVSDHHWNYDGENGPGHWGSLKPEYEACTVGHEQSPVDIHSKYKDTTLNKVVFSYRTTRTHLFNDGHTIQAKYEPGSFIRMGDAQYDLLYFDFHAPSEHTIDGQHFDLEMQLVHKNKDGEVAVVSLLIEEGDENQALAHMWAHLPEYPDQKLPDSSFSAIQVLPKRQHYYTYRGSLTTPPCTENVRWMVMETPIQMSKSQIQSFIRIFDGNSRPVQPLYQRQISATL